MVREREDSFILKDGTRLFEKTWEPTNPPKAHLIFLHGFSDRSEIQYYLFPTLASNPYDICCHAIDQRGWGKSVENPSQRGLTGPTSQVLADIDEYVSHVASRKIQDLQRTPLFVMGHSMGGQQVLHYLLSTSRLLTSRSKLSGAIIESPLVGLHPSSQPWRLTVIVGRLAAMISPKSQLKQSLDEQYITADPAVNRAWKEDPLCHDHGTLEGMRDMLQRGTDLEALSEILTSKKEVPGDLGLNDTLPVPSYWAHGPADRVTAFRPAKKLFDALHSSSSSSSSSSSGRNLGTGSASPQAQGGMTFKAYPMAYHKIHAEPDGLGAAFSSDVSDWILQVATKTQVSQGGRGNGDTIPQDVPEPVGSGAGRGGDVEIKAKL